MAARHAHAQVEPLTADAQAVLAPFAARRDLGDLVQVAAGLAHPRKIATEVALHARAECAAKSASIGLSRTSAALEIIDGARPGSKRAEVGPGTEDDNERPWCFTAVGGPRAALTKGGDAWEARSTNCAAG